MPLAHPSYHVASVRLEPELRAPPNVPALLSWNDSILGPDYSHNLIASMLTYRHVSPLPTLLSAILADLTPSEECIQCEQNGSYI